MSQPLPLESVNHIARATRELDKLQETIDFYCNVLGFREIKRPDFDFPGAWLFGYGVQIHLIIDADANSAGGRLSKRADHVAFHTPDIGAVSKQLDALGIEYVTNTVPTTGVTQIFFHDPNGYHIEVATYPPAVEKTV